VLFLIQKHGTCNTNQTPFFFQQQKPKLLKYKQWNNPESQLVAKILSSSILFPEFLEIIPLL